MPNFQLTKEDIVKAYGGLEDFNAMLKRFQNDGAADIKTVKITNEKIQGDVNKAMDVFEEKCGETINANGNIVNTLQDLLKNLYGLEESDFIKAKNTFQQAETSGKVSRKNVTFP